MPMRGELPGVRSPARALTGRRRSATVCADAQAVAMFCAIGWLATVNALLLFPDFGETIARMAAAPQFYQRAIIPDTSFAHSSAPADDRQSWFVAVDRSDAPLQRP